MISTNMINPSIKGRVAEIGEHPVADQLNRLPSPNVGDGTN